MARQVRAADDTRTSSTGPPSASDLKRKAAEHGVAEIWQDARQSLDYSVRTCYTKAGITYLQRTTTLPDGVRVRGSHCVAIGEAGGIRITFHPAAVDLCDEEFEEVGDAVSFEAEKPPNAPATRGAADQWYCFLRNLRGRRHHRVFSHSGVATMNLQCYRGTTWLPRHNLRCPEWGPCIGTSIEVTYIDGRTKGQSNVLRITPREGRTSVSRRPRCPSRPGARRQLPKTRNGRR